jgi:hypothetical protein
LENQRRILMHEACIRKSKETSLESKSKDVRKSL